MKRKVIFEVKPLIIDQDRKPTHRKNQTKLQGGKMAKDVYQVTGTYKDQSINMEVEATSPNSAKMIAGMRLKVANVREFIGSGDIKVKKLER